MSFDTLVIPDIHHKTDIVDDILVRHPDIQQRVFLGDVYDDFGDTPDIAHRTALWHKRMLHDSRNIFILGNHDITYLSNGFYTCSGYSHAKQLAINDAMLPIDWASSSLSTEVHGWTLTHAGYHPVHYRSGQLERTLRDHQAIREALSLTYNPLLEAGRARGGQADYGGVTWLDWNREFTPIPGVRQLVGHTRGDEPRVDGGNVCIDCSLQWYGIIRADGKLDLYETDEPEMPPRDVEDFGEAWTTSRTGERQ